MKVVELKALMAATIASGIRSNPVASIAQMDEHALAGCALADVEQILLRIEWLAAGWQMQAERHAEQEAG